MKLEIIIIHAIGKGMLITHLVLAIHERDSHIFNNSYEVT